MTVSRAPQIRLAFCFGCLLLAVAAGAQKPALLSLAPADTLHRGRLNTAIGAGGALYSATMWGLYKSWYAEYPATHFHFFDDAGEWGQMDKMGHWLMSYNESRWLFGGARWAGLRPRTAAWLGFAGSQFFQASFEVLDGFSTQWGFSWSDIGFNLLGSGLFLAQQLGWNDQRITLKMSAWPVRYDPARLYPATPPGDARWTTLEQRAADLYGTSPVSLFLKNYNTLIVWASINPRAFLKDKAPWLPRWLNVSVGMGADNLFAGYGYEWSADKDCTGPDCLHYRLDPAAHPRTRQFFLSLDVDLTRLGVRNHFLRTLLGVVNILKFPAPTLEWTDRGRWRFHPLYF